MLFLYFFWICFYLYFHLENVLLIGFLNYLFRCEYQHELFYLHYVQSLGILVWSCLYVLFKKNYIINLGNWSFKVNNLSKLYWFSCCSWNHSKKLIKDLCLWCILLDLVGRLYKIVFIDLISSGIKVLNQFWFAPTGSTNLPL